MTIRLFFFKFNECEVCTDEKIILIGKFLNIGLKDLKSYENTQNILLFRTGMYLTLKFIITIIIKSFQNYL